MGSIADFGFVGRGFRFVPGAVRFVPGATGSNVGIRPRRSCRGGWFWQVRFSGFCFGGWVMNADRAPGRKGFGFWSRWHGRLQYDGQGGLAPDVFGRDFRSSQRDVAAFQADWRGRKYFSGL